MNEGLRNEAIRRLFSNSDNDPDLYKAYLEVKKELEEAGFPPHRHFIAVNGHLCHVTVTSGVSIVDAIKAIQEANELHQMDGKFIAPNIPGMGIEVMNNSGEDLKIILQGLNKRALNEDSTPVSKDKKKHDWYKFNQRNKYGHR